MWAVVPVKRLEESKTRLSPVLDDVQRIDFALVMLIDVLRELGDVGALNGIGLMSDDERIQELARSRGLRLWPDRADTVNRSLEIVASELSAEGNGLIIVPGDLPTVTGADYTDLLARHRHGVTIAPSHDEGTNVLVSDAAANMPFRFGPGSLALHEKAARERNFPATICHSPVFAHDIDTPEDINWLLRSEYDCQARRWLRKELCVEQSRIRRLAG